MVLAIGFGMIFFIQLAGNSSQIFISEVFPTNARASGFVAGFGAYCCPPQERGARLPQLLSVYLLMFFLGSVTRYSPRYFEDLLDSKYGPLFATFISESSLQFLYLMASEILAREVSKPVII